MTNRSMTHDDEVERYLRLALVHIGHCLCTEERDAITGFINNRKWSRALELLEAPTPEVTCSSEEQAVENLRSVRRILYGR